MPAERRYVWLMVASRGPEVDGVADDRELVRAARDGDLDAFETLVGLPAPATLRAKLESVAAKAERIGVCGCSA